MAMEPVPVLYAPAELDILSRAFHGAIESVAPDNRDLEAAKAAAMNGILDAARRGERNAERLKTFAIEAIRRYEVYGIEPELRAAAL
jgi:hypothetical protein